ncbi:hypothetical protein [Luteolibacter luteus]|uniref:Uncharacterized protein n=1 Tax=Luteolibacter luteus TaxID=2728835 RepID=A0A858RMQ0_9BACT|nr:hypothetical protein [Luteolibacter luteus]QJE98122.1 hypothetical protein HHL09_20820 [Luteolibacter luteus]
MSDTTATAPIEAEVTCHICGDEAVMVVDGKGWCASCVHARGSCCAESEMDEE